MNWLNVALYGGLAAVVMFGISLIAPSWVPALIFGVWFGFTVELIRGV